MKTKMNVLFLFVFALVQYSNAQQSQTNQPKVENHLKGELDYTHEGLYLVKRQANGEEISLGKITRDGTIDFNLPEYDIKALYDSINLQHYDFHQLFQIDSDCKERDVFAETPFDDVYSEKTNAIYIKKYGIDVAVLEPASEEQIISNNNHASDSLSVSSKFFWFYIDRAIAFKEGCSKTSSRTGDIYANISADIKFEKGWNFIEEKSTSVQNKGKDDSGTSQPSTIQFTKIPPLNKKVKWSLRQITEEEKIQTAKRLYNLTPITKEQFEKWLPAKSGDFTRTSYELDKTLERSKSINNNVYLVFENGNQKMEIAIIDGAKNPDDLEMVNFAFSMDDNFERDDKPASDIISKGEVHHISKEDEDNKTAQVYSLFKDRIVLMAKGENMTAVQLWEGVKAIDVAAIIE